MNKIGKTIIGFMCLTSLSACGCQNSSLTKGITFSCTKDYPVDHDIHLKYQDEYEGIIKDNLISDLSLYNLHLYDNFDSYNEMKNLITQNDKNSETSVNPVFDDKKYTIKIKNQNEDNISAFISDKENKLYAKDFIKSLEDMEFKCVIKGAKRSDFGLE